MAISPSELFINLAGTEVPTEMLELRSGFFLFSLVRKILKGVFVPLAILCFCGGWLPLCAKEGAKGDSPFLKWGENNQLPFSPSVCRGVFLQKYFAATSSLAPPGGTSFWI